MLKFNKIGNQIILQSLGARKSRRLNRIAKPNNSTIFGSKKIKETKQDENMNSFYIWLQSTYEDKILSRIYVKYCSLDIKQQSINHKDRKSIQHFVFCEHICLSIH